MRTKLYIYTFISWREKVLQYLKTIQKWRQNETSMVMSFYYHWYRIARRTRLIISLLERLLQWSQNETSMVMNFDYHWYRIEGWARLIISPLEPLLQCAYSFSKSTKEVLHTFQTCYPLWSTVNFRITTWTHTPRESNLYPPPWDRHLHEGRTVTNTQQLTRWIRPIR